MSDIQFVEVDAEKIKRELINDFERELDETLYPGDERRIFLLQELPVIVGLKNDINEAAKQNLLKYAKREKLDALGGDIERLPSQKANTTLRFNLSSAQPQTVVIPAGTRATPDGKLYYATTEDLTLSSGITYGDVMAEAVEAGEKYNGFIPGQIKSLVDPIAFVSAVSNTTESSGGADIEDDEHYRERIRLAPASYSTAGPEDSYVYWAKTADSNIVDVAVTSPNPGEIKITILMKNGELPTQAVLDKVIAIVTPKKRRPMNDYVIVDVPTQVLYNIEFTYYISEERKTEEKAIREAIEDTKGAVDQYNEWQISKQGRGINPDYLRNLLLGNGAFKIDMSSPAYTVLGDHQVAKTGSITINYGGLI